MAKYHIYRRKKYRILLKIDVGLFGNRAKKLIFVLGKKALTKCNKTKQKSCLYLLKGNVLSFLFTAFTDINKKCSLLFERQKICTSAG